MAREVISVTTADGGTALINLGHVSLARVTSTGTDSFSVALYFQGNPVPMLNLTGDAARQFLAAFRPEG